MGEEDIAPPPPGEAPVPPVAPPPTAPPTYGAYEPKPKKSFFEVLVSNKALSVIVVMGLILVVLGVVLIHAAPFETNYGRNVPKDNTGAVDTQKEADDTAAQNSMTYTGNILNDIGMFLVIVVLLLAALLRSDISDTVRFGLLFAVGLIMLGMGI